MTLSLHDFYFKAPLYAKISVTPDNWDEFKYMMQVHAKFDGYNPYFDKQTTYQTYELPISGGNTAAFENLFNYGQLFKISIKCLRYGNVITFYGSYIPTQEPDEDGDLFNVSKTGTLMKIGQNPALIAFETPKIKHFKKVLTKDNHYELLRAIGLASHGVGIGSFVYVRRIFENLIEEAHQKAISSEGWDDETYRRSRMNDKINLLKEYLPDFLVSNQSLYGIISKGIHELSEQECLAYFDTILLGIERILEAKIELDNKKARDLEAVKKIEELKNKLK